MKTKESVWKRTLSLVLALVLLCVAAPVYGQPVEGLELVLGESEGAMAMPAGAPLVQEITTRVTYQGVPVANVEVKLQYNNLGMIHSTDYTDADGVVTFRIHSYQQNYQYAFYVKHAPYATYNGYAMEQSFYVQETIPQVELEMGKQIATRVTLDGVPQGNVPVSLYHIVDYGPGIRLETEQSDSSGYVTFPGVTNYSRCYFAVDQSPGAYASYSGRALDKLFSVPGGPIPDIELEVGKDISALVTLDGKPAGGVSVQLFYHVETHGSSLGWQKSDSSGNVTFRNVPEGRYYCYNVSYEDGVHGSYQGDAFGERFTVNNPLPEIRLEKGQPLTLRFTENGSPVSNMRANLFYYTDDWFHITNDNTDDKGSVTFANVLPGRWYSVTPTDWVHDYDPIRFYFTGGGQTFHFELQGSSSGGGGFSGRRGGGGSGGGGTGSAIRADGHTTTLTRAATAAAPVDRAEAVQLTNRALQAAQAESAATATVRLTNKGTIALDTMKAMAAAGSVPLRIHGDSVVDGKIDVRISFDPAAATKGISLAASTSSPKAEAVRAYFAKGYRNDLFVIGFEQEGDFGMAVGIAVKKPESMDASNLYLYSYDREQNNFQQIQTAYTVDEAGYVFFTTHRAGYIVISDQPLIR